MALIGTLWVVSVRKQFGQNICRLRTELGMTQEELCGKAEIDRSYLQRIENGGSSPTLEVASRLRKALQCDWNELLQGLD